ncbi:4-oxalocrotonate tautomerase [Rubrobacter marinus]|uniref:Tautomerase n=1 Tax=Rubrobacter marinus TaxID=2653852 RepID=A0A6G8Q0J0_9ACTN|nr:2-hydroxymuconate tautomerase family protein [Rubrobacter marinus]QIN79994.1 4-oxalocrotonate tautomerase [Rubrobacter marinus]
MLVIKTTMMEGRTAEQKEALIRRLSEVAAEELGWPVEDVRVVIYEVTKQDWGIAGSSVLERERKAK